MSLYINFYSVSRTVVGGEKVPFNHKTQSESTVPDHLQSCTQLLKVTSIVLFLLC